MDNNLNINELKKVTSLIKQTPFDSKPKGIYFVLTIIQPMTSSHQLNPPSV